jgi:hypothetical protein
MSTRSESSRQQFLQFVTPALVVGAAVLAVVVLRTRNPVLALVAGTVAAAFLGPPVWVWWDSGRLGLRHPLAWGVFALMAPLVGAVVYWLVRPDPSERRPCSACERPVEAHFAACPYCGTAREAAEGSCPSCSAAVEHDWRFCPYCRLELGS